MADILIRGMEMPPEGYKTIILHSNGRVYEPTSEELIVNKIADATEMPPHGDLIDRDALIKDGWLNLHKEVMRMGGYAIHELPLKNPSIPVVVPAERR